MHHFLSIIFAFILFTSGFAHPIRSDITPINIKSDISSEHESKSVNFHYSSPSVATRLRQHFSVTRRIRFAASNRTVRLALRTRKIRPFPRIDRVNNERWSGHLSATNFHTDSDKKSLINYKKSIQTVIKGMPSKHTEHLQELEIRNESHFSRGMANSKKMIIHTGTIDTEKELMAIFLHELGHVVDLGLLKSSEKGRVTNFYDGTTPILSDDPSLKYYRISWKNAETRKKHTERKDFISGYSMTNPFEDFSEHYLFYRLHGDKFRYAAKHSTILKEKYNFFRYQVFEGQEFQTTKGDERFLPGLIWDTTLVDFDKSDLLVSG